MPENPEQNKKVNTGTAIAVIVLVLVLTSILVYSFYQHNYCKDGDDFSLAQPNELWGIVTQFDLMEQPIDDADSTLSDEAPIARLDSTAQVVVIETDGEWKKVAVLNKLNVEKTGWVDSRKIRCARNLTQWMREHLAKPDTTQTNSLP